MVQYPLSHRRRSRATISPARKELLRAIEALSKSGPDDRCEQSITNTFEKRHHDPHEVLDRTTGS
jgi:hypothetical protein